MHFDNIFNNGSINKIPVEIDAQDTQYLSWENPHGVEKPSEPFP